MVFKINDRQLYIIEKEKQKKTCITYVLENILFENCAKQNVIM